MPVILPQRRLPTQETGDDSMAEDPEGDRLDAAESRNTFLPGAEQEKTRQ